MWPVVLQFMRVYGPYVTLPFAGVVGFIGYNIESIFRKPAENRPSTEVVRDNRLLEEIVKAKEGKVSPLSQRTFVPDNIFGSNLSPGLQKPSDV